MPSPNDDDVHAFTGVVNVSQPQRRGTDPVVQKLMNEAHSRVLARAAAGPPQILPHDKPFPHHKIPPAAHPLVQQGELGGMRLAWPPASKGSFVDAQVQTDATAEFMADEMDSEATLVEPLSAPSSPASRARRRTIRQPGRRRRLRNRRVGSAAWARRTTTLEVAEKTVVSKIGDGCQGHGGAERRAVGAPSVVPRAMERRTGRKGREGYATALRTNSWALNWMKPIPTTFAAMVIIVFNAIFAVAHLPERSAQRHHPQLPSGRPISILDLLLFASILVVGKDECAVSKRAQQRRRCMCRCVAVHRLTMNVAPADLAQHLEDGRRWLRAVVPAELARQISRLPQSSRLQNESQYGDAREGRQCGDESQTLASSTASLQWPSSRSL